MLKRTRIAQASAMVFAAGPAAIVAIPWLQHAGLIADTPLVVLVILLLLCSVTNALVMVLEQRLPQGAGRQLSFATASFSTAWVVYATGWGSLLVIGYAIGIAEAMRVHGSRAWRSGLAWSGVAILSGEVAIAAGIAPTVLRADVAHAVAIATFACLCLVVRTLGWSAKVAEDATARVEQGRSYFRDLVQHAADVIALVTPSLQIEYVSPGIEPLVGRPPECCIGRSISEVLGERAGADIARAHDTLTMSDYVSCEWHLTNDLGEQRRAFARLTRREDGSLVLNLRDVTEQRALEAQLLERASVDALTGLPNRASLMHELTRYTSLDNVTVLFIDLDGFKEVNDSLGHERGDAVLRDVAHRIAAEMPPEAFVGRLGGDEFLAVLADVDEEAAYDAATRTISGIQDVGATRTRFPLSASIGIATGTLDEPSERLLRRADQAMYRAKGLGPGHVELASSAAASPVVQVHHSVMGPSALNV